MTTNAEDYPTLIPRTWVTDYAGRMLNLKQAGQAFLIFLVLINFIYYAAFYYLLSSNNAFNFNNNYHLIGFLSFFMLLLNGSLFALYLRAYWKAKKINFIISDYYEVSIPQLSLKENEDRMAGLGHFIVSYLFALLTSFPLILYYLLDEFTFKPIHSLPLAMVPILLGLAHTPSLLSWLRGEKNWDLVNAGLKLACFLLGALLLVIMIYFLTGIIPAEIPPTTENLPFVL